MSISLLTVLVPIAFVIGIGARGIRTCFLPKKVSTFPKVKNITSPLIQAQHVVLVSGEV